ncbi:MAG: Oxidoreductase FAD/NAD(P)-binding domain protein [Thermotoga sp. 50_1627]|uniref:sulfide/dihydroorotate dehydrogenase-like FAD/NAD-binding protein n=1 Tax=Pseudothermotoga sp. TaxID=2033661 RepID=UPI00076C0D1E|nr:MAG: Oxidoreductase FAD/NAD(P)-binding domain protein [Thermotoga sp. 50_64]KUK24762.1 MAG: Oxidoreductase FAD/NAD(P)-binding domain protein [Thermotoga sp. 50_1627]MBC7116475.1 sulfide/dihydroorotate dehydrogenase-like FAD/NAD-binding protein [Pseudothermotoga sp.]MDK2923084.1 ferredoxin/flavodoxin---NADP+ reductase [Pseudothermotoga sp.]HBT40334.1 dihydroorotate dehydrogenase [Pseudothermotoga sp.]
MNLIREKRKLAPGVYEFWIENNHIVKYAQPGQFVVMRLHEKAERIPITIAGKKDDSFRAVVRAVGKSTYELCMAKEGDSIMDIAGPLGRPSEIGFYGNVMLVGGGVGIATLLPIAEALKAQGNRLYVVLGGRSKEYVIMLEEFSKLADQIVITTDDGSFGIKGVVTDGMQMLFEREKIDIVWAVGPTIMMKFCSMKAKEHGVRIWVSLNPIMVDGTGMCGACRVTVNGKIRFACVDGPEFEGELVDWDELLKRLAQYRNEEEHSLKLFMERVGDLSWL